MLTSGDSAARGNSPRADRVVAAMPTRHFQRSPHAHRVLLTAIAVIASTFLVTYPIAASALTPPSHRLRWPRLFLSASISHEPARTIGSFLLSVGVVPFAFAVFARKLELDLRRAQLREKTRTEDASERAKDVERLAFALHFVSLVGALGVCAAPSHVHRKTHTAFASAFFLGGAFAAACHYVVDVALANTCSARLRAFRGVFAAAPCVLAPLFILFRDSSDETLVAVACVSELAAMTCLCAYYASWAATFGSIVVVVGALDVVSARAPGDLEEGGGGGFDDLIDGEESLMRAETLLPSPFDTTSRSGSPRVARGGGGGGDENDDDDDDDGGDGDDVFTGSPSTPSRGGGYHSDDRRKPPTSPSHGVAGSLGRSGRNVGGIRDFSGGGGGGGGGGAGRHTPPDGFASPFRSDGRVLNGLRASPATPGVPRVDSSDRLYHQLHEPFMRRMEEERGTGGGGRS